MTRPSPGPPPLLVPALVQDSVRVAHLQRAAEPLPQALPHLQLAFAGRWSEVEHLAAEHPVRVVLFDPYPAGTLQLDGLVQFRDNFPLVMVVAYGDFAPRGPREVLHLVAMGVRGIVTPTELRECGSLLPVIQKMLAVQVPDVVLAAVGDLLPARLVPWMRQLLLAAQRPLDPAGAGKLFHRHPKTLGQHLRAARLPPVNQMIVWARLFHAADLLADPGRTVKSVALTLEFPSVNALRNQLQRYAHLSPQQVREGGGLAALTTAFRVRYAAGRWGGETPRRTGSSNNSAGA